MMIKNSLLLGCDEVVGAKDIVKGNEKVNIVFVAELFNTKHQMLLLTTARVLGWGMS